MKKLITTVILLMTLINFSFSQFSPEVYVSGLSSPTGLVMDGSGNMYVGEYGSNEISKIDKTTQAITVIANIDDGVNKPAGLVFDANGDLLVANNIGTILKINITDFTVSTIATALPILLGDIEVIPSGDIFVSEFDFTNGRGGGYRVLRINSETGVVLNTYNVGSGPYGLLYNATNSSVLVAHLDDHTVREINIATDEVTDLHIQDDPIASLGDLAFAPNGLLYSTEALTADNIDMSDEILQINLSTNEISSVFGGLHYSFGIAINQAGAMYISTFEGDGTIIKMTTPPILVNVTSTGGYTVELTFNEELDNTTATDINNYEISYWSSSELNITNAALDATETIVTLTTSNSQGTGDNNYTLKVMNVQDLAGDAISVSGITENFEGTIPFGTANFGNADNFIITGTVKDASDNPIPGYTIPLYNQGPDDAWGFNGDVNDDISIKVTSDSEGNYIINGLPSQVGVNVSSDGWCDISTWFHETYEPYGSGFNISETSPYTRDIILYEIVPGTQISGKILDLAGEVIPFNTEFGGDVIQLSRDGISIWSHQASYTDPNAFTYYNTETGDYHIKDLLAGGTYDINIGLPTSSGYSAQITVAPEQTETLNVNLEVLKVSLPAFNPPAGLQYSTIDLALTTGTPDATIYYTLDGSEPTISSTVYSSPIFIDEAMTVKAFAVKTDLADSDIAEAAYTFEFYEGTVITDGQEVSGTWTLANSPYVVLGEAIVAEGQTLTIEAGVEVQFTEQGMFNIYGTLSAVGTETDRILFTSYQDTPQPGDWKTINFIGSNASVLQFCTIEYASESEIGYMYQGAITLDNSSI
jgi:hypothetical protein